MNRSQYENSIFHSITPARLSDFLRRKGWRRKNHPNTNLIVFEGESLIVGESATVVFPSDIDFKDYFSRLNDTLSLLSKHFDLPLSSIIEKIAHWNRDVMRIRIQAENGNDHLLPFSNAAELINKYKDFVSFAACSEADPKRFYGRVSKTGKEFADNCRFGHTFVGSFGITIESPIPLDPQPPLPGFPVRPFHRAVTERIATGYINLNDAVKQENPSIIVSNYQQGFSGNMCDILMDIYDSTKGMEVSHNIVWASDLTPPKHLENPNVRITEKSYDILKTASSELQKVDEPDQDKTVVGRITQLRSKVPPLEGDEFSGARRTIVINWEVEKQIPINIHIQLPLDQYREACDAHKNGRKIRIIGKPEKHGKFWYLIEHHDFIII
jgi:hypothetical protein